MFEAIGTVANDLPDGDSGIKGRGVRQRKVASEDGDDDGVDELREGSPLKKKAKKPKKPKGVFEMNGYQWTADEEFPVEKLLGRMVCEAGRKGV